MSKFKTEDIHCDKCNGIERRIREDDTMIVHPCECDDYFQGLPPMEFDIYEEF